MKDAPILFISGGIGSGKTTLCSRVADLARENEIYPAGVICPAVFEGSRKTGIRAVDLKSLKSRKLAVLTGITRTELETGRWSFFADSLGWANRVLKNATPCKLLIVDELGPLEFKRGQGFTAGMEAVDSGDYRAAVAVIRPGLLDEALGRWPDALVWKVTPGNADKRRAEIILNTLGFSLQGRGGAL